MENERKYEEEEYEEGTDWIGEEYPWYED